MAQRRTLSTMASALGAAFCLAAAAAPAHALSLQQAYEAALRNDPTYRMRLQEREAGKEYAVLGRAGVNLGAALDVINASSGRSNASENLIPQRVLTREFPATFALGLLAKDAGIATDLTQRVQGSAPVLAQVAALLRAAQHAVGPAEDHTAALKLIEAMNAQEIR